MVCVHCGHNTAVTNSRHLKRSNQIWRRRQCLTCKSIVSTTEQALYSKIWVVRGLSGALKPFSRDKLLLSIYASCQHRKNAIADASALTDTVISKLPSLAEKGVLQPQNIAQVVQVALNRFDGAASTHYQAFHQS